MGKMFNKVVKAVNKSDEIFKRKQKIDKLAKGIILTKEEHQDLNTLRAEYLTETDEIAREQSRLNLEFDVKYHNCAINFIDREIEWWENRKKKEVKE